jgi:hypothetical protein
LRENFYECQACYSKKNCYLFSHIVFHVACWTFICVIHVPFNFDSLHSLQFLQVYL